MAPCVSCELEEALQSIHGCGDVMLPYWDETSHHSVKDGIPWALTKYALSEVRQRIGCLEDFGHGFPNH